MNLTSSTFTAGGTIPQSMVYDGFGLTGGNRSPQLSWSDVPPGTKSFAIICHDPDAPTSGGFYHWVMFNLPGDLRMLDEGAGSRKLAAFFAGETLGHTDYGSAEYGGPCPPPGSPHRYVFTLYALDIERFPFGAAATGAFVEFNAIAHTLAKATITGTFARP